MSVHGKNEFSHSTTAVIGRIDYRLVEFSDPVGRVEGLASVVWLGPMEPEISENALRHDLL
jgi:hypothetical protein